MPVPLVRVAVSPGMSVGMLASKFHFGKSLSRKLCVMTPLPASASTSNFEAGHTRSWIGALNQAP